MALFLALFFLPLSEALVRPLSPARRYGQEVGSNSGRCHSGLCGGMAKYPVNHTTTFYSEFNVPGLPKKLDGITYYIYFNIFFPGKGDGKMNQFVPQLMLGNSLSKSSGPPLYKPIWEKHESWVFGSQYFMEIYNRTSNNSHEGHAATGDLFPTKEGEIVYTKFELSQDAVWTLTMGVKGDKTRVSTVVSETPFMGLVSYNTTSWSEPEYSQCFVNSCWELYGVTDQDHFPSTGSKNEIDITTSPNAIQWKTHWNPQLEKTNCTNATMTETHTDTKQTVIWNIENPPQLD
eukprot:m.15155 g.15155  ORF g.15155 m.15155 type:complete len:290 (+) comp5305_c0_seq2:17-886(+)